MHTDWFDEVPDRRGPNSLKWGKYHGKDILPLWVADMDFKSPPAIIEEAINASRFGNYGYGKCPESLYDSIIDRCLKLYGWEIEKHWIVWLPGMVCALNVCCRAFENASQAISQTPIYPPFLTAPGNFGLQCRRIPMIEMDGRFSIDFESLSSLSTSEGDLFLFCHPHNPVGTAYTNEELSRLCHWVEERKIIVCSDEIHCDLILEPDVRHKPFASVGLNAAERTITLMAPSKTFNLPGFGCSYAIISNPDIRSRFKRAMAGIVPDPPAMSFSLTEAAYRHGESWRQELLIYLRQNRNLAFDRLSRINGLTPYLPEATYLMWINATELGKPNPHSFFEDNGVGLSDGKDFGAPGFLRLNLGCSRELLEKALSRIEQACSTL